jgi:hypothetical protein
MTSRAFELLATETATTKRPPLMSGGKRGVPVAHITTPFALTPLVSADFVAADRNTRVRPPLDGPYTLLQTFTQDTVDIVKGDLLTVDSVDYPVQHVEMWPMGTETWLFVIVEKVKP